MRPLKALAATLVSLSLLVGACSDDETVDVGDGDGSGVELPDRGPDLTGTITAVSPFEPITEDCVPADEVDPNGAVSNDDPPICTPEGNDVVGTVLVEEDPDDPEGGRKISFTVTTDTTLTGAGVGSFADLTAGQVADTWVTGPCAESYPEQCGLEAIRVTR